MVVGVVVVAATGKLWGGSEDGGMELHADNKRSHLSGMSDFVEK